MNYCPNCGSEVKGSAKFCKSCGYNLEEGGCQQASFSEQMKMQMHRIATDTEAILELEENEGINVTRAELKKEVQRKLSGTYGDWFKSILLYLSISVVLILILNFSLFRMSYESVFVDSSGYYGYTTSPLSGIAQLFWLLFFWLVVAVLVLTGSIFQAVWQWCGIFTLRGQSADGIKILGYFIKNQKNRVIKANVLVAVYTFLWSLLFVIPGIVKGASYAMTNYLLEKHPDLSANEAIDLSREIMHGYKLEFLILRCSFFVWWLVAEATFGLAIFYVLPYQISTEMKFLDMLYEKHQSKSMEENAVA